jgi:hypothetical protein
MKKTKQVLISIVIMFQLSLFAQQPQVILQKMISSYKAHPNYSVNLTYEYYDLLSKNRGVLEKKQGFYAVNGVHKYFSLEKKLEVIDNSSFTIKINHSQQAILVSNSLLSGISNFEFDYKKIKDYTDVSVVRQDNKEIVLLFKAKPITQLPFVKLLLYVSKDNYFVTRQEFEYFSAPAYSKELKKNVLTTPKLVVSYSNYKFNNTISKKLFDISKYISIQGQTIVGIGKYHKYQIINQLKK